jgi:U3 small nucleolar RNA-associated protein 16
VQKSDIPAVLPAEFLEDSSSEDEDEDAADSASGPKRRKVSGVEKRLTRLDAGPKDEVVNSTVYRVAKKTDERMAPKLKKHTKSSKDLLLKRNRPAAKSGTGFFKK